MSTPFHCLLFDLVPPFRAIRAPTRWAMVADMGFALLAGVATAALIGAWSQRRSKAFGFGIAACLSGALLFEDRVAPLSLHRGEPDPDPLTRFLKETPMAGGLWEMPDAFNETNAHHVLPPRCRGCRYVHGDRVGGSDRLDRPADRVRHYPWRKFTWKKGP